MLARQVPLPPHGYEAAYVGGYVTGGSTAVTEPLLSMTEQVALAGAVAQSVGIPGFKKRSLCVPCVSVSPWLTVVIR